MSNDPTPREAATVMLEVTLGVVLGVAIWVLSGMVITALGWAQ